MKIFLNFIKSNFFYLAIGIFFFRINELFFKIYISKNYSPEMFGNLELFLAIINYLGPVVSLGMTGYLLRHIPLDKYQYRKIVPLVVSILIVWTFVLSVVIAMLAECGVLNFDFFSQSVCYFLLFPLLLLMSLVDSSYGVVVSIYQSFLKFYAIMKIKIIHSLLFVLFMAIMIRYLEEDGFMLGYFLSLVGVAIINRRVLKRFFLKLALDGIMIVRAKKIVTDGMHIMSSNLISKLATIIDLLFINYYFSKIHLGIYASAIILFRTLHFFLIVKLQTLLPRIPKMTHTQIRQLYADSIVKNLLIIIPAIILLNFFSEDIILLFFAPDYLQAVDLFPAMSAMLILIILNMINGSFLLAKGHYRLNLAINTLLIASLIFILFLEAKLEALSLNNVVYAYVVSYLIVFLLGAVKIIRMTRREHD